MARWMIAGGALMLVACTVGNAPHDGGGSSSSDASAGTDSGAAPPRRDAGPPVDAPARTFDAGVCTDVVDVVFVLDVSSSMSFVLEALEADIPGVVRAAAELAPEPHFGFIGFADNGAFADNGSAGVVHTEASTLSAAFRDYRSTYTDHDRNPGDGPSGPTTQNPICEENSLDALYAAATDFPWRDNATRVIIVATDDTFLERPDNYGDRDGDGDTTSTDFPREGDYPALRTAAETLEALKSNRIRVFSFTRLAPPGLFDFGRCGTGRRLPWGDVSDGWSTPYGANEPFPSATDAQNFDLVEVREGSRSLADTISDVVVESYCDPPLI